MLGINERKRALYLKIMTKDCEPHFEVRDKEGKEYVKKEDVDFIEGYLIKVEKSGYEYKGDNIEQYKLHFVDGDEYYLLTGTYSMLGKSIINCLANIDTFGKLRLSIYTSKAGYAAMYVENKGVQVQWKYDWEFQKAMVDGDDYTELDAFFAKELLEKVADKLKPEEEVDSMVENETKKPRKAEGSIYAKDADTSDLLPDEPPDTDLKVEDKDVKLEQGSDGLPF